MSVATPRPVNARRLHGYLIPPASPGLNLRATLHCRIAGVEKRLPWLLRKQRESDATAMRAVFRRCQASGAVFEKADLRGANFKNAELAESDFSDCNLTGANFTGADVRRVRFTGARLGGAQFADAQLDGACFAGASGIPDAVAGMLRPDGVASGAP